MDGIKDIAAYHKRNNEIMAANLARARTETQEERDKRHQETCRLCRYSLGQVSESTGNYTFHMCDFVCMTGRMRPCAGMDCREMGVWEPRETNDADRKRKRFNVRRSA